MRCSSCEVLLDRYVEATLSASNMRAVSHHLKTCAPCGELLTELRIIDGLLATTRPVELAPNFTFAVMAKVRSMPIPQNGALPVWTMLGFYLVATWVALITVGVFFGSRLSFLRDFTGSLRGSIATLAQTFGGTVHTVGPVAPLAVSFGIAILAIDLALVATIILFYRTIRPRLAAQLSTSEAP